MRLGAPYVVLEMNQVNYQVRQASTQAIVSLIYFFNLWVTTANALESFLALHSRIIPGGLEDLECWDQSRVGCVQGKRLIQCINAPAFF